MLFFVFLRNFTFDDCHVEGARTIARAAKQVGVHRFIHVSALNANEESTSQFLQSKVGTHCRVSVNITVNRNGG